jgi:nicotinamidase-related amidase
LPHIVTLLAAARAARIAIVHVCGHDVSETGIERGRPATPSYPTSSRCPSTVVRKLAPNASGGTILLAHHVGNPIEALVVTAQATSGCIRASVVDPRALGSKAIVAEERTVDRHAAHTP